MLHATARYQVWRQPGSGVNGKGSGRWKPRAEQVRPLTQREVVAAQDQMAWFRAELARHQACFTRQAWHTLTDVLNEVSYAAIAARDGITVRNARQRYERLLTFLGVVSTVARKPPLSVAIAIFGIVCQGLQPADTPPRIPLVIT